MSEEERLTATVRANLLPTEYEQLRRLAIIEDRTVAALVRRAVREMLQRAVAV
jgi:hypothetical protein